MKIETIWQNQQTAAVVTGEGLLLTDVQSALDLAMTVQYETDCRRIALYKENITEDFFKLSTCLAGEVLQKYINYHIKVAIIGNFDCYTSKPLHDFIYESNSGRDVFFVPTREEALERLLAQGE